MSSPVTVKLPSSLPSPLPSPPDTPELLLQEALNLMAAVPNLGDYDISPRTGFLPEPEHVLQRLADEYFAPWEELVANLSSYLLAGRVRSHVREMPTLDVRRLQNVAEYRRAFVCLSFIAHAYVWGHNEETLDILPASVSIPWTTVSRKLRLHPICSYPSVVLWNYRALRPHQPLDLHNLGSIQLFTGCMDEAWFYLVSCAVESAGARALPAITGGMTCVVNKDVAGLTRNLRVIEEAIQDISEVLLRMYDGCDPHIFYHRIRKFLPGWAGNPLLPDGVFYEGVTEPDIPEYEIEAGLKDLEGFTPAFRKPFDEADWDGSRMGICKFDEEEIHDRLESDAAGRPKPSVLGSGPKQGIRRKFAGGSAAQSPVIQALDIALGVEHRAQPAAAAGSPPSDGQSGQASGFEASRARMTDELKSPHSFESPVKKNYIYEMRAYLPGPHRSFLLALSRGPSMREFVHSRQAADPSGEGVAEMVGLFNRCVDGMRRFRDKHLQMVSVYILIQGKKKKDATPEGGGGSAGIGAVTESKGTGGTNILPFLRQSRDETISAQV